MNVFTALPQFFSLFQQGQEIANAATWKNATVATNVLVGVLGTVVSIASSAGYALPVDGNTLQVLGSGIVAAVGAVNAVMHVITSAKVGFAPKA
jgi:hypothetical protein